MITHRTTCRVIYADTDNMGVAYHANYLRWFEIGRTELFRSLGIPYKLIETKGIFKGIIHGHDNPTGGKGMKRSKATLVLVMLLLSGLALLVPAIALPYLANATGWIFTEIGRAPWLVFGLMTLEQGLSVAVTAGEILLSLVAFTLVYAVLIVANVHLLRKYAKAGLAPPEGAETSSATAVSEA